MVSRLCSLTANTLKQNTENSCLNTERSYRLPDILPLNFLLLLLPVCGSHSVPFISEIHAQHAISRAQYFTLQRRYQQPTVTS